MYVHICIHLYIHKQSNSYIYTYADKYILIYTHIYNMHSLYTCICVFNAHACMHTFIYAFT